MYAIRSYYAKTPHEGRAIVEVTESQNMLINNCYQQVPADIFLKVDESDVIWGNNFMNLVKEPILKISTKE